MNSITVNSITVTWMDHHREPQCASNPAYPDGVDVDLRADMTMKGCTTNLPYPAKRCGVYLVVCNKCDCSAAITTAGRRDDPRTVTLPCKLNTREATRR